MVQKVRADPERLGCKSLSPSSYFLCALMIGRLLVKDSIDFACLISRAVSNIQESDSIGDLSMDYVGSSISHSSC